MLTAAAVSGAELTALLTSCFAAISAMAGFIAWMIRDRNKNWVQKELYEEIMGLFHGFKDAFQAHCNDTLVGLSTNRAEIIDILEELLKNEAIMTQALTALKESIERLTWRMLNGKAH